MNRKHILIGGSVLGAAAVLLGVTWLSVTALSNQTDAANALRPTTPSTTPPALNAASAAELANAAGAPIRRVLTVRKNDTLSAILTGAGVTPRNAHRAIAALSKKFSPRNLKIGQALDLTLTPVRAKSKNRKFTVDRLSIDAGMEKTIIVEENAHGAYAAQVNKRRIIVEATRRGGVIKSSLYLAGQRAQVPPIILAKLTQIFSFDVDFQRDVQAGDRFTVMYERLSDEQGKQWGVGKILIAEMTLSGKAIRLYRHKTADGKTDYYNDKGQSARKSLTLTPIDGARISSGYGRRKHPILGYNKMHRGVDFAASRGTPIYAGGRGVVEMAGRNGAYGRYIRIRHNATYKTAYAHMKGFAKGIRKGRRVKQGQVIGYVGTSGRSTGPHLHYEILKNKRQVNPRRLNLPSGRKLRKKELAQFLAVRTGLEKRYAALPSATQVAANPGLTPASGR